MFFISIFAFLNIATFVSAPAVSAAAKQSTLSLTMETGKLTMTLSPELNGRFVKSSNAGISVTTDNYSGYRLTITSNGGTSLSSSNGRNIESVDTAISETVFRNNASYVNKWGYKPSQYVNDSNEVVTSNTNYLPAPSTTGSLIDVTSAANSTAKTYTLSIAAKIDFDIPPGTYTRNITLAAIANDIIYNISYDKNTADTVTNMPVTNPQIVTIAGGTAAASSKTTLSNATPTRTGYDFMGWCSTTTTADAAGTQTCSGTTYAAGADYGIDQTADGTNITLRAIWKIHDYTITINYGPGISSLSGTGWEVYGDSISKTFHIGDTVDLATIASTYNTGYSGAKYAKTDTYGTLSGSTYTVGAGDGSITFSASTLDTPVCEMTGGSVKVYNRTSTMITATSNSDNYDINSVDITYSFGYASSKNGTLGNFGPAQTGNTTTFQKDDWRGIRYYGVTVVVTDVTDNTITATCTSGTGTGQGTTVANRATVAFVNSRVDLDANGGTLAGGNNPFYVSYQSGAKYTTRVGTTAATVPTVTPPDGYAFDGWYTASDGGDKVLSANGTVVGAVTNWTNADGQWIKTATTDTAGTAGNVLYAHYIANTYDVTLDQCSATTSGSTSTTATYGATTLASINNPQRAYTISFANDSSAAASSMDPLTATYTFGGWVSTSCGSSTLVASYDATPVLQADVTNFTDGSGHWARADSATLYAKWASASVTLPTLSKAGYTCNWTDGTNDYTPGASIVPGQDLDLYASCTANPYTVTITTGNGVTTLTASGWDGSGTSTISKTFYTDDVIDLTTITPTRATGYVGTAYEKTDTYGTLSGSSYIVGPGAGAITLNVSGIAAPTCEITGGTTKVYNYQNTTLTATDTSVNYDSNMTITYNFGYADTDSDALDNFSEAQAENTFTVTNSAYRGTRYYGVTIDVTDGTFSSSCTSATGTGAGGRTEMTLINSRIDFDANGGTLNGAETLYVSYNMGGSYRSSYGGRTWNGGISYNCYNSGGTTYCSYFYPGTFAYTTATGTAPAHLPSATAPDIGYELDGWYTAATGGSRITGKTNGSWSTSSNTRYSSYTGQFLYAPSAVCGTSSNRCNSDVAGWKYAYYNLDSVSGGYYSQYRYWRKTGTDLSDNVAENRLYAHYKAKQYTITLDKNGATNNPTSNGYVNYDATQFRSALSTLPVRSYTISGWTTPAENKANGAVVNGGTTPTDATASYAFDGWYQEAEATHKIASSASTPVLEANTDYTDANGVWKNDGNVTLYAGWTGQSVTLPTITKYGSVCGWTTVATDATTIEYASGAAITPTTDMTLYGVCIGNYLQDITPTELAGLLPNVGDTVVLLDKRDETGYMVGKLADGNYWFLENLALDLLDSDVQTKMNSSNTLTNASQATINKLINGGGTTSDKYPTAGIEEWSSGVGSYSRALVDDLSEKDAVPSDSMSTAGGWKNGGYYNYCAASAGSYCYGNGTTEGTSAGDDTEDICPSGWRMPTGGTGGEYDSLYSAYGNSYSNLRSALRIPLSGYYWGIHTPPYTDVGSTVHFWASTRYSNSEMNLLYLSDSPTEVQSNGYYTRNHGFNIRCVAKRYLQDVTNNDLVTMLPSVGSTTVLTDKRDETDYTVGRLKDGNYWLLENLSLDLTDSSVQAKMNSSDTLTNASQSSIDKMINGGGTASDKYAITGVNTQTSGGSYSEARLSLEDIDTVPSDTLSTSGGWKVGGYYNYCATSAGSYCYGDGASEGTPVGNATEDICPSGWRLATDDSGGEYRVLYNLYNNYTDFRAALHLPLSGYYYDASSHDQGTDGYFWSSTYKDSVYMYDLRAGTSLITPQYDGNRRGEGSIRCFKAGSLQSISRAEMDELMPDAGTATILFDSRDGNKYTVGKLEDDKFWMLDNLALDLTNSSVQSNMNNSFNTLTNASQTSINKMINGGGTTSDQYPIAGVGTFTFETPNGQYQPSWYNFSRAYVYMNDKDVVPTNAPADGLGSNKAGGYYNYCATSAGSYCYGDGISEGTSIGNATEDICPSGWRLGTGGTDGEYGALAAAYNNDVSDFMTAFSAPIAGGVSNNIYYRNSYVWFWTSTRYDNEWMYSLDIDARDTPAVIYPAGYIDDDTGRQLRPSGQTVRCVSSHLQGETYDVTLDGNGATNTPTASTTVVHSATALSSISTLPVRAYNLSFALDSTATGATVTYQDSGNCTSAATCASVYNFTGWYQEAAATNKIASSSPTPALEANTAYTNASGKWTHSGGATLYAGWDGTNASVTLPTIVKNGYSCVWKDQNDNTYASGASIVSTADRTLTGYCTGNTYTATFYYQSDSTLRGETISTATAQCTVSNSAGNCTATIPTAVRNSVGTYNNAYAGVAATVNTMAAANSGTNVTLTGNANFYAIYRTSVLLHKPVSSSATTDQTLYRNQYFTSNSALSTKLSTSTTGTANWTYASSFTDDSGGYGLFRLTSTMGTSSSVGTQIKTCGSAGTGYCSSVAAIAASDVTEAYVVENKVITATFYYNNNTNVSACTAAAVTSTTNTGNRYAYITAASVSTIGNRQISIPDVVTNSKGTCGMPYLNVGTSTGNMTAVTPNTSQGNKNYYARYSQEQQVFYYHIESSGGGGAVAANYTYKSIYRNQRVSGTSASSVSTIVLADSTTGTSNYTTEAGPGSSEWTGLAASSTTTPAYTSVAAAATANKIHTTPFYTIYTISVTFAKGANTSAIGGTSGSCKLNATNGNSGTFSCSIKTPTITPNAGYTACGWNSTNGATSGTNAGSNISVSINGAKYYGNSKDITAPSVPGVSTQPYALEITGNVWWNFRVKMQATDTSGSNIKFTITNTTGTSTNTCGDNEVCEVFVRSTKRFDAAGGGNPATAYTYNAVSEDAAGNKTTNTDGFAPQGTSGWSAQNFYVQQLYGGIRAAWGSPYQTNPYEQSGVIQPLTIGNTKAATVVKDIFRSIEAQEFYAGKSALYKCQQMYHAIFGREIDSAGSTTCSAAINNNGGKMGAVAASLANSNEAQSLFALLGFNTGNAEGSTDDATEHWAILPW
ncbi:InlB B-repeat-containing protein [Candidatus Saccharibacteria bacterium]|nr:InlB B-repeat-containing protein [Candidatus Saccharibacteria bacterium]